MKVTLSHSLNQKNKMYVFCSPGEKMDFVLLGGVIDINHVQFGKLLRRHLAQLCSAIYLSVCGVYHY
jgi:hypothetical protein